MITDTVCSYCGRSLKGENEFCIHCGAPIKINKIEKYDPFFYNGYIVYSLRDISRKTFEFVFYKGTTLQSNVFLGERELSDMNPTVDYMDLVFQKSGLNE